MHCNGFCRGCFAFAALCFGAMFPGHAWAGTVVRIDTNLGPIDVELFDDAAPLTVNNFLNYAATGRFQNTIFHRAVRDFIAQSGAFTTDYGIRATDLPVKNEVNHTNIRGTIAMAKRPDNPDSATNQWFINLSDDNASNLDNQNEGFTVFGKVISGMNIADAIASAPDGTPPDFLRGDFSNPRFGIPSQVDVGDLPVRNYTVQDFNNSLKPDTNHLAIVNNITVIGDSTSVFQNPDNRFDSNDNNTVVPHDVLLLVDNLRRNGERALPDNFVGPLFVDIDGNKRFNSSDIDSLVAHINTNGFTVSGLLSHSELNDFTASGHLSMLKSSALSFVPEPGTLGMAAAGLMALFAARRRMQRGRDDPGKTRKKG